METDVEPVKAPRVRAPKIDRQKVEFLASQGLTTKDIAQHQGVAPSTIFRFLQRIQPERQAVTEFKQGRADVLADLHARAVDVQMRIIDGLDDGVLAALTASQKSGLLLALNATAGTVYDKERLERGQSTSNVSLISRMMGSALDSVGKEPEKS